MAKRKRREKKPQPEQTNENGVALDQTISDLDDDVDMEEDTAPVTIESQPDVPVEVNDLEISKPSDEPEESSVCRKKRRKTKHAAGQLEPAADTLGNAITQDAETDTTPSANVPSKHRYILFVGNLPYDATTASIKRHFSALEPNFTIRHSTDKATGRSKGYAFLEFENDQVMRRCIKGYHHSLFFVGEDPTPDQAGAEDMIEDNDAMDGIHPSRLQRMSNPNHDSPYPKSKGRHNKNQKKVEEGRRINIELTAGGGGGKSTARKEKLKAKNEKLHKERARVRETQRKLSERTARNRQKRAQEGIAGLGEGQRRQGRQGKGFGRGATGANAGAVGSFKRKFTDEDG